MKFRKHKLTAITFALMVLLTAACSKKSGDDAEEQEQQPVQKQVDIAVLDNAVAAYMTKYKVPGVSLAITKGEKLVYVKAYGKSDNSQPSTKEDLFRIASVSKSITAIAVMKLVEEGKLALDNKVFGDGALLGNTFGTKAYSNNLKLVTIKHLLNHTAGGWGNTVNDPMFTNPTMTAQQLITWTLDNYTQSKTPGTVYDYSNFGFCILGRVIEKLSGKSYEQYVKDVVLIPAGVKNMMIGGNTLADRRPMEVQYFGTATGGPDPYAYNISRMDAHGGWIANATDLVRLMVRFDGFNSKADLLKPASITAMTTVPSLTAASNYACGWGVNAAGHWWHTGSLPGSTTDWVRTSTGFNWAILANTRVGNNDVNDLDAIVWTAINANAQWQDIDQF